MPETSFNLLNTNTATTSPKKPVALSKFFCDSSVEVDKICPALVLAQAGFETALKSRQNPHLKNWYADLGALLEAIREPFKQHSLALLQPITSSEGKIHVRTIVLHESAQWLASDILILPVLKPDAQGFISASTYAKRASLQSFLAIETADDDGEACVERPTSPVVIDKIEL